jgi:cytochrome c oxidase subunit IV
MKEARYGDYEYEERQHPEVREYVQIAIALCAVIVLELVVYYVLAPRALVIPLLGIFAAIKFFIIGAWFMHLRFDSRLFRRLFIAGLALAVSVFFLTLLMFLLATPFSTG